MFPLNAIILLCAIILALIYGFDFEDFYFGLAKIVISIVILFLLLSVKVRKQIDRQPEEYVEVLDQALQDLKKSKPMIEKLKTSDEWLYLSLDEQYEYIQKIKEFDFKRDNLSIPYQKLVDSLDKNNNEENVLQTLANTLRKMNEYYIDSLSYVVRDDKVIPFNALNVAYNRAFHQTFDLNNNKYEILEKIDELEKEKSNLIWRISKGVEGERDVVRAITSMLKNETLLESVRIEHDHQSAESDVLIISSKGLYTLEIKNEGSAGAWNIRIAPDGQWQKVYQDGKREAMKDHGGQMNHHIAVKERFLNEKLKEKYGESAPYIKMTGAIVIANDNVIVDNESDLSVLRKSSVHRFIENGTDQIEPIWQERIKAIFEDYSLPGKKYKVRNIQVATENLIIETMQIACLHKLRYEWLRKWATHEGNNLPEENIPFHRKVAFKPIFPDLSLSEVVSDVR